MNLIQRLRKSVNPFIWQRIGAAALTFLVSMTLARLLGSERFGHVAFFIYLPKLIFSGQLGSSSGFLLGSFNKTEHEHSLPDATYYSAYSIHLFALAILTVLIGVVAGPVYFWAGVEFAILVPLFALETLLRVRHHFFVSLLPDLAINVAIVISIGVCALFSTLAECSLNLIFALTTVSTALTYFVLYPNLQKHTPFPINRITRPSKTDWANYFRMVGKGLPLFLGSLFFAALLFVDRFFLERWYPPTSLSVYMLSFQIVSGCSLIITSQNFANSIDLGEQVRARGNLRSAFTAKIRQAIPMSIISYLGLLVVAYLVECWVSSSYVALFRISVTLGAGLLPFHLAGSVSPIVFYRKRQQILNRLLLFIILLSITHNVAIKYFDLSTVWIARCTALWLICCAIFTLSYTWRQAQNS